MLNTNMDINNGRNRGSEAVEIGGESIVRRGNGGSSNDGVNNGTPVVKNRSA